MAWIAPVISAVSGVLGIVSGVKSLTQKSSKPPTAKPLPDVPKPEDAAAKAAEEAKKRRRQIQSTDLTKGAALVPEVNIERKSLLGQ